MLILLRSEVAGAPGEAPPPSQVVAVRFTPEEIKAIDARARELNVTRSELIREAVLA